MRELYPCTYCSLFDCDCSRQRKIRKSDIFYKDKVKKKDVINLTDLITFEGVCEKGLPPMMTPNREGQNVE